ncbi:MAG TPA: lysophospholipid acyltransferase family protein [Paludibacter sp.]
MKSMKSVLFSFYQWLVVFPLLLIITIMVALSTIILSPLLPNSQLSYNPARLWARICCKLCFVRVIIMGLEKLNPRQSYVFALNHQSIFDIFVVYGWFPFIFKWMMKAELRKIPLVGKACESAGHIFIDRSNPIAAKRSLLKAEAQLINGVSLVVFPEGTRTYTGKMGQFKRGAFRISTDLSLPIVPVTLRGSFERLQRNSCNIKPGTIKVYVHMPIDVSSYLPDRTNELIQKTWDDINSAL